MVGFVFRLASRSRSGQLPCVSQRAFVTGGVTVFPSSVVLFYVRQTGSFRVA